MEQINCSLSPQLKCSYGKILSQLPSQIFPRKEVSRRDLGNRASPVHRAHMRRSFLYTSYVLTTHDSNVPVYSVALPGFVNTCWVCYVVQRSAMQSWPLPVSQTISASSSFSFIEHLLVHCIRSHEFRTAIWCLLHNIDVSHLKSMYPKVTQAHCLCHVRVS